MAASFKILKYTGSGAETEVSSLGFKRIDSVVAGSQDVAVDDRSDSQYYQIYTPEGDGITSASFEVWFKMELDTAPDNQLSNIRLYVTDEVPEDDNAPNIKIGQSVTYQKPTNAVSSIATTSIYTYTEDNPLKITKDGLGGYAIDGNELTDYSYQVTVGDTGSGNVFYLDSEKQKSISLVKGNTYIFNNTVGSEYSFRLFTLDVAGDPDTEITDGITITNAGTDSEVISVDTTVMFNALGTLDNISYQDATLSDMGSEIELRDPSVLSPTGTFTYSVEVIGNEYYIDGVRKPSLVLQAGSTYIFNNASGDAHPFRIHKDGALGGTEESVVVKGVDVDNGGTVNEVVTVVASDLFAFNGTSDLAYQSTNLTDVGNKINDPDAQSGDTYPPVEIYQGQYNMNTVGDKTDFIVMQVQVEEDTTPGDYIPDIKIIWDES